MSKLRDKVTLLGITSYNCDMIKRNNEILWTNLQDKKLKVLVNKSKFWDIIVKLYELIEHSEVKSE